MLDFVWMEAAKGIVDKKLLTVSGNEAFYDFLGGNFFYPFVNVLHDDDKESFIAEIKCLEIDTCFKKIIRIKDTEDKYHWMLTSVKKLGLKVTDGESYEIEMNDVFLMEHKQKLLKTEIKRYRDILSVANEMIFEYKQDTDELKIYSIRGNQEILVEKAKLLAWQERCVLKGQVDESDKESFISLCNDIRYGTSTFNYEIKNSFITHSKNLVYSHIKGMTIQADSDTKEVIGTILSYNQTERILSNSTEMDSKIDPLTGLLNKKETASFAKRLIIEKPEKPVAICIMDVDDFKTINDSYGHLFGDKVLAGVANMIKNTIGTRGVAGRFGGDEFLFILFDVADEDEIRSICRTIRNNTRWMFANIVESLQITASIGIAAYPKDAGTYDDLFILADHALYLAKQKGKNRYIIYDIDKHGEVITDKENHLLEIASGRNAIDRTGLVCKAFDEIMNNGKDGIQKIFDMLSVNLMIDRIIIYSNAKEKSPYSVGRTENDDVNTDFLFEDDYFSCFSEEGIFVCNDIANIDWRSHNAYTFFNRQDVFSVIQFLIKDESDIKTIISFEVCKLKRKWGGEDINNLTVISRFVSSVI